MTAQSRAPRSGDPHESLSALVDGESDDVADACRRWREDASTRTTWYAYHLIGDVLRSEDLANRVERDAAVLAGVRARLAREPVPIGLSIAPAVPATALPQAAAVSARRLGWRAPAALTAGFAVVAGVLVMTRGTPEVMPEAATPIVAAASASAGTPRAEATLPAGALIRDPELDAYLRAHQWARGGTIGSPPGVMLRNVDMAVPVMPGVPVAAMPAAPRVMVTEQGTPR